MLPSAFVSHPLAPSNTASRRRLKFPVCSLTAPSRAASASKSTKLDPSQCHFLHVDDFSTQTLGHVLETALAIKERGLLNDPSWRPLEAKAMSMVFAKPSARTRVSFETAMFKAGGHALCLGPEVGVNTRESAKDVSRVLSGMTDLIMARLFAHNDIVEMAEYATVPVINGLTDYNHPCQIVADALTILETRGSLEGVKVAYVGDGNNIVHSWLELAAVLPIDFTVCCPDGYEPDRVLFDRVSDITRGNVRMVNDPMDGVKGADYVYSDVWASMGQKEELSEREKAFEGFQVNTDLMKNAGQDAKFLHCLPAERGRECTDEVMESDRSIVFRQAENRMHAQIAVMLACMGVDSGV